MKVLIVLTSHDQLGSTGRKTGFWLEEFAAPYYEFVDAGCDVTLASPKGGQPPLDPMSDDPSAQTDSTRRFKADTVGQTALASTHKLADVKQADYDAIFYPGGHGPLWDLADDKTSVALIESFYAAGKPVSAVCHAPIVLHNALDASGEPIVKGKKVTSFSNTEEAAVGLTEIVPYLVEDELQKIGGLYSKGADWSEYVVVDGKLVTGQNPASSAGVAREVIKLAKK